MSCPTANRPHGETRISEGKNVLLQIASNELDPLDNEILERAFDATWDAIKGTGHHFDAESDEELEAALRRELIEIARLNGVNDPDTLKDIFFASMPPSRAPRSDPPG